MNKTTVLNIIKENLLEILPELEDSVVPYDVTLIDLGMNSVDRSELITLTLERLALDVSRIEFVGAHTMNELADLIMEKQQV